MKLKFDAITLKGFNNFKFVPKTKKPKEASNKRLTKLVVGNCIRSDDTYKIIIDSKVLKNTDDTESNYPDLLYLEFTEESYNIKGVISVFDRKPDERGKYVRYIRNELNAKMFPGSKERLVPFCHNWACSGYIVRRNGKLMFDFNECICPYNLYNHKK